MGREIKHVPLGFEWELHKTWKGYINPYCKPCPQCEGGCSKAFRAVEKHTNKLMWDSHSVRCCPEYAQITTYLAGRKPGIGSHDSIDAMNAVGRLGELAGLPEGWDVCPHCQGEGIDPVVFEAYEAWEPYDPPQGDGWQVWETVSGGSPISPIFATSDELVDWLVAKGNSQKAAEGFVQDEWAPSAVMVGGKMYSGIESCALPRGMGEQG